MSNEEQAVEKQTVEEHQKQKGIESIAWGSM